MTAPMNELAQGAGDHSFLVRRYADDEGRALLSGVQALVRLPMVQMRRDAGKGRGTAALISGYEGSPLAGYDLELARNTSLLQAHHIVFQPAVNEELAATAIAGSQLVSTRATAEVAGVLGIWYGKAPGLDRATDAIRHGNLAGADHRGGVVMLVGDDPATKSSSLPSASELGLVDLAVPVFFPGSVQDLLDYGLYAVALSRLTGLWTSLKVVVGVADSTATVDLALSASVRSFLDYADATVGDADHRHVATALLNNPVRLQLERGLHRQRLPMAESLLRRFPLDRIVGEEGATIGILSAGKTYVDVVQALERIGLDESRYAQAGLRLMKVGALYPTSSESLRDFADGLRAIVVVEEKRGPLESAVRGALYGIPRAPVIVGKVGRDGNELFPRYGELDVDTVERLLRRELTADLPRLRPNSAPSRPAAVLPVVGNVSRAPFFCSGCPHSRSTPVPDGALVGAGIGCHALVTRSPRSDLGDIVGLTQMGGEGAQWLGIEPFVADSHLFQNIGDGTLSHSGTLAIRAAVAAQSTITYKILYNSAVAMTGGQHPAGIRGIPDLTLLLHAEGVSKIIVTTESPSAYRRAALAPGTQVRGFDELIEAQEELARTPGVTVLIHDQECAAELRRKRKRGRALTPDTRILINPRVCEGCGDCGRKSNCLSVVPLGTEFGGKTQIHQESCNLDRSCVNGHCPSFVTVKVTPGDVERRTRTVQDLDDSDLPAAVAHVSDDFTMRVTGVGGTGIVTVAQIVAMAGVISGRYVVGIDQTGMAQKGGPVVSDLKISTTERTMAAKLAQGECDLYLVADLLTGVESQNLAAASAQRTSGVVSTSRVAPAALIGQPFTSFPEVAGLLDQVRAATMPDHMVSVDCLSVSNQLFHNDVSANLVLLGAAFQSGAVPLSTSAIEEAITLNGVSVHQNIQAFRRGRQAVADPAALDEVLNGGRSDQQRTPLVASDEKTIDCVREPSAELRRLLAVRVPDLRAYQNNRYAERYATLVGKAREAELRADPPQSAFSEAVATYFYKLMAYKDEYEVARLSLDVVNDEFVQTQLGVNGTASYNLLPPVLARFGLTHKIRVGPWFRPVFRILRSLRRLRGTAVDPFGRHPTRRLERELIVEYEALIRSLARELSPLDYDWAVQVAQTPDLIRGFDEIKLAGVEAYRARLAELNAERPSVTAIGQRAGAS